MCYSVCGMVHIKEPLLLIDKSSLCCVSLLDVGQDISPAIVRRLKQNTQLPSPPHSTQPCPASSYHSYCRTDDLMATGHLGSSQVFKTSTPHPHPPLNTLPCSASSYHSYCRNLLPPLG